jgi:hypothetical protein
MVYLGGPRGFWSRRGLADPLYLHDPPAGYSPPKSKIPLKERRRNAIQNLILLRVATVTLALLLIAFLVLILVVIATYI